MANQWGRGNPIQTRSSGGYILPLVLVLLLAGGAGYGWYMRTGLTAEIAGLESELSTARASLDEAVKSNTALQARLSDLRQNSGTWAEQLEKDFTDLKLNEVPKLTRLLDKRDKELEALQKEKAVLEASATDAALAAEKQANDLKRQLADTTGVLDDADQAARTVTADHAKAVQVLRDQLAAAKAETDRLRTAGDTARQGADAAATQQIAALKEKLRTADEQAKQQFAAGESLRLALETKLRASEASVSNLRRQIDAAPADQSSELNRQLAEARDALGKAEAETDRLRAAGDTARQGADAAATQQIAALTDKLRKAEEQAKQQSAAGESLRLALETKLRASEASVSNLRRQIDAAPADQSSELNRQLAEARDALGKAEAEIAALKAAAGAPVAVPQVDQTPATIPQQDKSSGARSIAPRDAAKVDAVLEATPGISGLDLEKQVLLRRELVEGRCVTDALESVFDRVPLIVMRNLTRGLESGC